jgi:hypothetical protein
MSSEMPANDRDTQLRQMLVATASAAPIRSRRRWSVAAPIAAFALAGALTGTVSAAAFTAPKDDAPATVKNLVAEFVQDDTQLFGDPVELSGQGETVIALGEKPDSATELSVIFHCQDPGTFDLLIDGETHMTTVCSENSTSSSGSGGHFTVEDMPTHSLTVAPGDEERYTVWASWAARAVPPAPSPEQAEAMLDGEVSEAEYHAQFDLYSECMTTAGYPLEAIDKSGAIITYSNSGASVTSGAEDRCYAQHFSQIDLAWQSAYAPQTSPEQAH